MDCEHVRSVQRDTKPRERQEDGFKIVDCDEWKETRIAEYIDDLNEMR